MNKSEVVTLSEKCVIQRKDITTQRNNLTSEINRMPHCVVIILP